MTLAFVSLAGATAFISLHAFAASQGHAADLDFTSRQLFLRLVIVGAIAAGAWFMRSKKSSLPLSIAVALAIVDMLCSGRFQTIIAPRTDKSPTAQFYAHATNSDPSVGWIRDELFFLRQRGAMDPRTGVRVEILGGELGGNLPMSAGLTITQGINPLVLASYETAVGSQDLQAEAKQFTAAAPTYESGAYRHLSLRYLLLDRPGLDNPGGLGPVGHQAQQVRAQLIASPTWAKNLGYIDSYEVWELEYAAPKAQLIAADGTAKQACDLLSYRNISMRVHCHAGASQRLVIGDNFSPGWKACVNGHFVSIQSYNHTFRILAVPDGDSEITLSYQPIPWLRSKTCD